MLADKNIMIDLETLGTKPGCAILSIGAVEFDLNGIYSSIYREIDIDSSIAKGFAVERDTLRWWMNQADGVRKPLFCQTEDITEALNTFKWWCGSNDTSESITFWGNGASFDLGILRAAYAKIGVDFFSSFQDRCYRTVKNMYPEVKIQSNPNLHNALEDAKCQALHLIEILKVHNSENQ